jgi:formylmethanofuran dehydrogenase subunit B
LGGKVSCTLGEIKNRADFIVYWGGNPAECHPRHFTKYTLTQKGKFVPGGRKDRTMVLVDIRETPSVKAADVFLQIRPNKDFEVLTALRAIVKGQAVNRESVAETGLTLEQLQDFANQMKQARFGVIFFGMGVSMTRGKHMNSAAILTLAAELNAFTKFGAGRRATRSASTCVAATRASTRASSRPWTCSSAATTTPPSSSAPTPAPPCPNPPSTTSPASRPSSSTPR